MRHQLPRARPEQAVGLLGGSFDPPHAGHLHISREALRRFDLDAVWWLVSPGNPLKQRGPAPIARRMAAARALAQDPRILVTDIEARLGTRYTAATLRRLLPLFPRSRFVWLMGADNLAQFHLWQDWRWIMETLPIGVLARPEARISARLSKAAAAYPQARLPGRDSRLLARAAPPAWCFVNLPLSPLSSTRLRAEGGWSASSC